MRTRINNITFTPGTRSITTGITDLTIDDIRLFINESQMKVICSSMQKDNVVSISSGVVTYKDTFPVLAIGDHITFEIDRGDDVAKKTDIPSVASIQNGLAKTTDLSNLAEKTDIPDDYAKPSDIPTVVQIQNGLAKTTDLPTDYAKAGTPVSGTAPTMVDLGTAINAIPTTTPATPTNVSDAQAAIIQAMPTIPTDYAKAGSGTNVTNTDIKNALTDNSTGLSAISQRVGQPPQGSSKSTLFAYLSSIWNSIEGQQQEDLPEGLADRIGLLLQFFNIVGSYEAEDIPISTVLSELDTMWENIWGDTPPVNTDNKYITFTVSSVSKTAYRAVIRDVIDAGNAKALCFVDIDNIKYYVYYNGTGGAWDEDSSTLTVGDNVYSDSACTTQVATITGGTSGFVITT